MNANDPALPSENDHQTGTNTFHYSGLTKRELIAAMALQGLLTTKQFTSEPDLTSYWAIKHTDALIAELSKDQSK